MKHLAILITFFSQLFQAQAQQKNKTSHLTINWKSFGQTIQQSANQLAKNKAALLLNDDDALQLIATTEDELGFKHYRYQQQYKGIPVEGAIYLMHERHGKVALSNGQLIHQLKISVEPTLNADAARQLAIKHVPAKLYAWQSKAYEEQLKRSTQNLTSTYFPNGTLTIIDSQFSQNADNYRLAYKFNVIALEPIIQKEIYVDAHNGDILFELNNIHSCTETMVKANTNYSDSVDVSICSENGSASLLKSSLYGGLEVRDCSSNNLISVEDSIAAEVMWATQKTFDYFNIFHNRNITDSVTGSKIDYSEDSFGAYYYSGKGEVYYSNGNGTDHNAYTTPDIVGHELTHGVNKFSAHLGITYESSALNESFADIFGEMVEAYCLGNADWVTGAQVSPTNNGLRNLANPKDETMKTQQPNTYLGEKWRLPSQVCILYNDYCGAHRNSGVQNYWFYLLANGGNGVNDNNLNYNIAGIGKEKAAKIAYRNLTTYLTPKATYKNAWQGAIQAAIDLFGANSFEVKQTRNAWHAVGVMYNPIKVKTENESLLADGSIQFDLTIDSLNLAISTDGLIIDLDVKNNYDIISVKPIHSELLGEEIVINPLSKNETSIKRINPEYINANEALFKIVVSLKSNFVETSLEKKGGTTLKEGSFIPFEDVVLNIPIQNCSNENTLRNASISPNLLQGIQETTSITPNLLQSIQETTSITPNLLQDIQETTQITPNKNSQSFNNGVPLIISIIYESCSKIGSAIVKILEMKNTPYAHIWRDEEGTIVYEYIGYEQEVEVPDALVSGLYQVKVSDTDGNCTSYQVKVPLLTSQIGNKYCGNTCPDYLVTPDENLLGTYTAKLELEVKGYVSSSQNVSFNICY